MTLDVEALMAYSGQGECGEVEGEDEAGARYREYLRAWAASRNWAVTEGEDDYFHIGRI